MVLGSLPKVNLIREGIHERYQKKIQTETSSTPQDATLKPARCRKKYHHGMCTSPWWQLPEIALCSCATLRNTSNPVLETQPFPESSVEATHCRDPCWMAILPRKVTPDKEKHFSTAVVRQMVLHGCHFQQAGKGLQWEKGAQSSSPANIHINNCWLWWRLPERRPEIV